MEDTGALLAGARAAGCTVDSWSWGQQHLDDVFLQLTRHTLRDD
jgi:hypothetical protein